jgi:hypothetical protein
MECIAAINGCIWQRKFSFTCLTRDANLYADDCLLAGWMVFGTVEF